MTLHFRATGRHLPYGITQCCLPRDTSERAPPNPSHASWYTIYQSRRDGRLSWPSWLLDLMAPRPGVKPATFRSRVWRRTTAPTRQVGSVHHAVTQNTVFLILFPRTSTFRHSLTNKLLLLRPYRDFGPWTPLVDIRPEDLASIQHPQKRHPV